MSLKLTNAQDLATTVPGLYVALAAVLVSFGITLPALPSWVPTVITLLGGLLSAHLIFNSNSKASS